MFAKLDAHEIAALLPALQSVTYNPGEYILHKGELATAMYFIASGVVEVETPAGNVTLSQGDYFGEMALIEHRHRTHNVRADTMCRLLVLEAPDFERLMRKRPELLKVIRKTAMERKKADEVQ